MVVWIKADLNELEEVKDEENGKNKHKVGLSG
jgi:hypothetical protein